MDIIEIRTSNGLIPLNAMGRTYDRLQRTLSAALTALEHGVQGDFADFGIAQGTSTQVLAHALARATAPHTRKLALFDSFQGYPALAAEPDIVNPLAAGTQRKSYAKTKPTAEAMLDLLARIYDRDLIAVHAGWFEDTVKLIPPDQKFACVNLDGTLYSSNLAVLSHLFEHNHFADGCHVLIGGFVGPRQFGARKAWIECAEKYKPDITDMGFYGTAHWHCIIHGRG